MKLKESSVNEKMPINRKGACSNHSNEYISGRIQGLDGGSSHGYLHKPGYLTYYVLHEAPVVQYRDHCAEVDHDREHLKVKVHCINIMSSGDDIVT